MNHVITVFGSGQVGPESDEYLLGYQVGHLIGQRGWTICNGGYNGTMESVARGAKDAGGGAIGVLVRSLDHRPHNDWLDGVERTDSLLGRLDRLVTLGEAYVVLPGGIGTLLEMALVWNMSQVRELAKPIVMVGPDWAAALESLGQHLLVSPVDREQLLLASDAEAAVAILDAHFG